MKRIFTLFLACLLLSACANLKLPGIFRPGGVPQTQAPWRLPVLGTAVSRGNCAIFPPRLTYRRFGGYAWLGW